MITLLDTSVCSQNLGDSIIMDAVRSEIGEIFPNAMLLNTATHEKISNDSYQMITDSDFAFVGGSNLISSNMNKYNQWRINLIDSLFLKNIILMGVGWWQYQNPANFYTRYLLNSVLSRHLIHSVRDSYSEKMLRKAGFSNVVNTSCPTMWSLTEDFCTMIPVSKAKSVVTTLTDYNKKPENDRTFLDLMQCCYDRIYFWPQGAGDYRYIHELGFSDKIEILSPRLEAYDSILRNSESIDFVGTRLHAGIRALQHKRRAIIIGIDNRAVEKSRDFNLVLCMREDLQKLEKVVHSTFKTSIKLPTANIKKWKSQFQ